MRLSNVAFGCGRVHMHLLSRLHAFALDVSGGAWQVDQAKVFADSIERFGMAQKKISVRQKIIVEVLNDAPLGGQIKVNEHIAAEDDVDTLHESHARVVGKI